VVIDLILQFYSGGDNDGMADNLSLVLNAGTATGPTTTPTATPTVVAGTPVKSTPTTTPTATAASSGGTGHTGTLIVTAFTSPGHPAVGAEVQVYLGKKSVAANYTDSSGVISFTLPPGTYSIQVDLHDAETTIPVVKVTANTITRETASLGAGTLHVLVEMAPGRPATDAEVQVYRGNTSVTANYTDAAGTYVFTLDAGAYTLHTTLGDAVGPVENVQVNSGAATQQTVNLNAGTLQVRVDLSPGRPADGAEVQVYRGDTSIGANYTDTNGTTSFILNAGSYSLHPSLGDATGPVVTAQVKAGETARAGSTLNAGTLTVKVLTKSGQPANGAPVAIYAGKTYVTTKYTDDSGNVSFILNAGSYDVEVSQGSTTNKPIPVKVTSGTTGDYTVRLGT
jgi:5-hydroxyisourate hydrolase-like protein (transthyretin family)